MLITMFFIADDSEHIYNNVTAIVIDEPQNQVIVNTTNETIVKEIKKGSGICIEIAPGENKIPTDWLREDDFDTTAFYHLHPRGENGLNARRKIKLSPHKYFCARIMQREGLFSGIFLLSNH